MSAPTEVTFWACAAIVGLHLALACSQGTSPPAGTGGVLPEGTGGLSVREPSITLGEPVTLLNDGALGLHYFPDEGTSRLDDTATTRLIVSASTSTYLVEGDDLMHLSQATEVVAPGAAGEFDNGYAGVSAVVRIDSTYYGFYHAEDQEDLPALESGIPGYYASIGLVTSEDGRSWVKRGQVLTSSQPKSWAAYANQADRGAAEPGAVLTKDGRYVLLYYSEHSRAEGRSVDICVARADVTHGPPLPGTFLKYHQGSFSEPGIGGADTPVVVGPDPNVANALEGHVVYSPSVERYLMIFGVDAWQERFDGQLPALSGLYSSWSEDGVTWSRPVRLIADYGVPQTSLSLSWEGSVVWDDARGAAGHLLYGYSPSWGTPPHYLVGRRMTIEP